MSWYKAVDFTADRSIIALAADDQTIKLWKTGGLDPHTPPGMAHRTNVLLGHEGQVFSLVFSPDSGLLASGSDDGTIKLWDVPSGNCIKTLRSELPYERMQLEGATGLSMAQKISLRELGAN